MFSLPRAATTIAVDETRDGLPIISVTESSHILNLFLRILYPVDSPKITKLADVRALLEVSRKYEIEAFKAPVSSVLEDALEDDPVGVFALSLAYGLNNIVAHAAHCCILLPISKLDSPELEQISIHQYRRLLQFHFDASQEISAVLAKTNWFREVEGVIERERDKKETLGDRGSSTGKQHCHHCWVSNGKGWVARRSVWEYIHRVRLLVQASQGLHALSLRSSLRIRSTESARCAGCGHSWENSNELIKFVHIAVEAVQDIKFLSQLAM